MGSNHVLSYRAEYKTGGAWVTFPGLVNVITVLETGDGAGPFAFGGATLPRAILQGSAAAPATGYRRAPVRVYLQVTIDGVTQAEERIFGGIIQRRRPGVYPVAYEYECGGADERIRRARVRTPVRYRRPLATQTTLTSVEDPAAGGYRGGLLNEVFWRAGGRPYEQLATYTSADWYYACDGTSVAPKWSCLSGEQAWDEALALAAAAGGQIYIDTEGTVRYVNPLRLAEVIGGAPVIADTGPQAAGRVLYDGELEIDDDVEGAFNVAVCTYQARELQPRQEVYKSRAPFPIDPSAVVSRDLATQWPVLWRDLTSNAVDYTIRVTACRYDGAPVTVGVSVTAETAQVLTVSLTNPLAEPILVAEIAVDGRPISVGQEGTASYTGARFDANLAEDVERRLDQSFYIQSQAAAERRARMAVVFEGVPRPVYTVRSCPYLPSVAVGGYARLYSARYSLSDVPCRIIRRELADSGQTMSLTLADVSGLPTLAELWVVDTAYADSDTRRTGL